jgi:ketosteroid isomerase-like protein
MGEYVHPDITVALPHFSGTVAGRDALIAGFAEFCKNARVIEYAESDRQVHVVGNVAVASYRFSMVYEREAYREHSQGRDIWVFEKLGERWQALWRTMVELEEVRTSLVNDLPPIARSRG